MRSRFLTLTIDAFPPYRCRLPDTGIEFSFRTPSSPSATTTHQGKHIPFIDLFTLGKFKWVTNRVFSLQTLIAKWTTIFNYSIAENGGIGPGFCIYTRNGGIGPRFPFEGLDWLEAASSFFEDLHTLSCYLAVPLKMAFLSRFGNPLKQSGSNHVNMGLSSSNSPLFQSIRSMSSAKPFVGVIKCD
ncbi:unnamed protein product [Lactuca virosa]|uniref:Uncharacterized protein n=1 Tax=Lactuca virosa TaxID=75947 RepID=A0AAU9P2F4_9ASTR|nr:unnamed protein product [Lactuca virosa]